MTTESRRASAHPAWWLILIFLLLALSILFWKCFSNGAVQGRTPAVDARAQERVAELIQDVLGPYRGESGLLDRSTNSLSITSTNIEANFRAASMLMPNRLDLRLGLASALIGLSLQTNSQFDLKMRAALQVFQDVQALDKTGFQAGILYAAYTRAIGDTNASSTALNQLMALYPEKTRAYLEKFQRIDNDLRIPLNEHAEKIQFMGQGNAIVILGAGLGTNGVMKPKLVARLKQALLLARAHGDARIIVTGGNARGGITEAYAMSLWLSNEGVPADRLYLEDRATDTVGNAIRSCAILKKLGVAHVTIVTSASHLPRALADFEEAALDRGLHLKFSHLVSRDQSDLDEARNRVAVYRDVLRTSGIWAFPGIQR